MTTIINYFLLLGFAFGFSAVLFFALKTIKLI
jgi:Cytochrome B6-F complex subunit VI (PetL)